MKLLRIATVAFALIIMGGEVLRSWGERSVIFWIDDFMVGIALIVGAVLVAKPTSARRAFFSGAWGFSVGVIYISFFDKVIGAQFAGPGAEFNRLNVFVTISLLLAVAGFVGSLVVPFEKT